LAGTLIGGGTIEVVTFCVAPKILSEVVKQGELAAEHTVNFQSVPVGVIEGLEVNTTVNEAVASSTPLA
jgi:hypothetical protein